MKKVMLKVMVMGMVLMAHQVAYAFCTDNPRAMGREFAEEMCNAIASGWIPNLDFRSLSCTDEDIEETCSYSDVIQCKAAMQSYLRYHPDCKELIMDNVELDDGSTAGTLWRESLRMCNMP